MISYNPANLGPCQYEGGCDKIATVISVVFTTQSDKGVERFYCAAHAPFQTQEQIELRAARTEIERLKHELEAYRAKSLHVPITQRLMTDEEKQLVNDYQAPLFKQIEQLKSTIASLQIEVEVASAVHPTREYREIVAAVVRADNSDHSVCYQLCDYSLTLDDTIAHRAPCVVEKARKLEGEDA